jgi:two-component system, NtrC family, response regulator
LSPAALKKRHLLVVEDDPGLQSQLKWCFEDYDVTVVGDREAALGQVRRIEPAVVTLDLGLPPDRANASEGLATLQEILALAPSTKIIVVTGNDDRENAVRAVAGGAYDFYQKPIDPEILGLIVNRAYSLYELEQENVRLSNSADATPLNGVIAASAEMTKVCRTIERVSPTDVSVLLLGESGTGKEVLTRALHDLSRRGKQKLVAINCAAIPETLLESELFGYEKGAFTGANKQTIGKIEYADGGTLFLDEIGDLPHSLQPKLLRFLQERTIERVGGREEIPVDVRVVCATHQDLKEHIKTGQFREDLFYRISEVAINIPALRERSGDPILLAQSFLRRYAQEQGRDIRGLADDAVAAVQAYTWPGNARELENRMKRAVIMADGIQITAEDLELEDVEATPVAFNLRQVREEAENQVIKRALMFSDNKVAQAAEMLGVSRPTLYDLMEKHGLKG